MFGLFKRSSADADRDWSLDREREHRLMKEADARNASAQLEYEIEGIISGGKLRFYVKQFRELWMVAPGHFGSFLRSERIEERYVEQFDSYHQAEAWVEAMEARQAEQSQGGTP